MNSLSWLIYFADILGNLKVSAGVITVGCLVVMVISAAVYFAHNESYQKSERATGEKLFKRSFIVFCVAIFLTVFTPSRNTIILIAASQYGQMLLTSDKAATIVDPSLDLLKTWIVKEKESLLATAK